METELCNMCMITDAQGRVLVQERLPKPSNPWSGLTFPGGHVEPGETVVASVIREVQEETGLTVSNLQNCGYIQWYNPVKQSQYFVFLFKTCTFSGITGVIFGIGVGFVCMLLLLVDNDKTQLFHGREHRRAGSHHHVGLAPADLVVGIQPLAC